MPKTPAIDHDSIRDLAKLLDETGLSEIEIQRDGVSIRVTSRISGLIATVMMQGTRGPLVIPYWSTMVQQ